MVRPCPTPLLYGIMILMRRNLFLYLTIACFVGLIAIFVVDGYMGIYDTVYITTGEREQQIEPDYWQNQRPGYAFPYYISARWGESVNFRYEVGNRRFSAYSTTVEASIWQSNEKVVDLFRQEISVPAFNRVTVQWTVPADMPEESVAGVVPEYTMIIKRGEIELGQGIILSYYPSEGQAYPKPLTPP